MFSKEEVIQCISGDMDSRTGVFKPQHELKCLNITQEFRNRQQHQLLWKHTPPVHINHYSLFSPSSPLCVISQLYPLSAGPPSFTCSFPINNKWTEKRKNTSYSSCITETLIPPLACFSSDGPCPESCDDAHLWTAYGEDKAANHLLQRLPNPFQLRGMKPRIVPMNGLFLYTIYTIFYYKNSDCTIISRS